MAHGVSATESVAKKCAYKDTREGENPEEELPFRGRLDIGILHDAGDDGAYNAVRTMSFSAAH